MLPVLFTDTLTIALPVDIPDGQGGVTRVAKPTTTSQVIPGRIEAFRSTVSGRSSMGNIGIAGDVLETTHLAYLPAALYNADGSIAAALNISLDSHVFDQFGTDYLVIGVPKAARRREGDIDHYEVELKVIGGAI